MGGITSSSHETDTGAKYRRYTAAGLPVYVLVHRQLSEVQVFSDPDPTNSTYRTSTSTALGGRVALPAPYPVLDTAPLVQAPSWPTGHSIIIVRDTREGGRTRG